MRLHRAVALWLLPLLSGCATARGVRLETDRGEVLTFAPRTDDAEPVELDEDEFKEALSEHARTRRPSAHPQEAARRLFEMDARGERTSSMRAPAALRRLGRASTWRRSPRKGTWN